MAFDISRVRAVLFDYGNTLIQFARPQVEACDAALADRLAALFGSVDRDRLKQIRDADRVAPFRNGLRERDLSEMTRRLVWELYGRQADTAQIADLLQARFDAVVRAIEAPPYICDLLAGLRGRFALGIVSNYPDGVAIRTSLSNLRLAEYFNAVVISADVGHVKPHPLPFQRCLEQLGVAAERAVYVGDNWLADVQGAKRLGMQMIRTAQYEAPERFDPQPGDFEPDAVIEHIMQLPQILAG